MKHILLRWFLALVLLLLLLAYCAERGTHIPVGVVRDETLDYFGQKFQRRMVSQRLPNGAIRSVLTDTDTQGRTGTVTCLQPDLPRDNNLRRMFYKFANRFGLAVRRHFSAPLVCVRRPLSPGTSWHVTLVFDPPNGFRVLESGKKPIGASVGTSDFQTPFDRSWTCGFDTVWYPNMKPVAPTTEDAPRPVTAASTR